MPVTPAVERIAESSMPVWATEGDTNNDRGAMRGKGKMRRRRKGRKEMRRSRSRREMEKREKRKRKEKEKEKNCGLGMLFTLCNVFLACMRSPRFIPSWA